MWIRKLDVRLKIDFDLIFNLTNTLGFSTCVSWMEGKLGFFVRTEQFSARSTLSVIGGTDFPCSSWSVTCFPSFRYNIDCDRQADYLYINKFLYPEKEGKYNIPCCSAVLVNVVWLDFSYSSYWSNKRRQGMTLEVSNWSKHSVGNSDRLPAQVKT